MSNDDPVFGPQLAKEIDAWTEYAFLTWHIGQEMDLEDD